MAIAIFLENDIIKKFGSNAYVLSLSHISLSLSVLSLSLSLFAIYLSLLQKLVMAQPHAVCLDSERRRLFIADTFNHRVLVVSLPDGHFMFKFGTEGSGTRGIDVRAIAAQMSSTIFLCYFFIFTEQSQINIRRRVSAIFGTVFFNGNYEFSHFTTTYCCLLFSSHMWIRFVSHPPIFVCRLSPGAGALSSGRGEFRYPGGLAYWDGCLFVSDSNHSVQMFDAANGQFLRAFGSRGDAPGRFNTPFYMTGMFVVWVSVSTEKKCVREREGDRLRVGSVDGMCSEWIRIMFNLDSVFWCEWGRFNTPFYMTGMLFLSPFSASRECHIYFAFCLLCFISLSFSICFSL
jgi:hypothetical protein